MSEMNTENLEKPTAPKRGKKEKPKKSIGREILEWIVTLAVGVAIACLIRGFVFEPVCVDGHSMDYTLADGEIMLVTKYDYLLGEPQRFDVIICNYPDRTQKSFLGIEENLNFVKRIVGLPGDVVEVTGGYLYVNGEKYEEPYITNRPNYTMKPYTVPEGMYFVLGDNRSNSNDSHLIGPIDHSMVVGHVRSILWPASSWRAVKNGLDY